jgi:hypothetical protein
METVDIWGMVESFDCPQFVKDPEATITLLCFEPDFIALQPVSFDGMTSASQDQAIYVDYEGSIETGILLKLRVNRELKGFEIHQIADDDTLRILEFAKSPLIAGDILELSTISGAKRASLYRGGYSANRVSVLYGVQTSSNWINLYPGANYIRVYAEGAPVPFTIEYTNKYGGL